MYKGREALDNNVVNSDIERIPEQLTIPTLNTTYSLPILHICKATMRSSLFFLALPALAFAAPPESPRISKLVFSGTGCPNDSGSVKADSATLGDGAGVSFTQLKGTDTDNCAVHIQSNGGSAGWQVAVREITYQGDVNLRGNSALDTFTQIFWSENAGNTVSQQQKTNCHARIGILIDVAGYLNWRNCMRWPRNQGLCHSPLKHIRLEVVKVHWQRWQPRYLKRQLQASGTGRLRLL